MVVVVVMVVVFASRRSSREGVFEVGDDSAVVMSMLVMIVEAEP